MLRTDIKSDSQSDLGRERSAKKQKPMGFRLWRQEDDKVKANDEAEEVDDERQ
jgi:hypothetical protein